MTQKQKHPPPLPIEDPPTASSSDEDEEHQQPSSQQQHIEEVSSSEEDEESPSQEEDNHQPPTNPHPKPSSSDSDSKPTDQAQKPKPQPSPESPKSIPKRPAQNNAHVVTDPKRAKKKPPGASFSSTATAAVAASDDAMEEDREKSGGGQTKFFQRLFSEEDELAILKGIPEFISWTGQDPYKYADAFRNFVKKSLRVEASSSQLKEKMRRLKKKFETKARKKGRNGEDPVFSRSHDRTVFELSKKAWGEAATGLLVEMPKPNGKRKTAKTLKKEAASRNVVAKSETKTLREPMELEESGKPDSGDVNVNLLYRQVSGFKELDEDEMKRGLALIGESKRKELEGKWKKLRLAEIELFANRSLLIGEQIKLIFEALQSSNH